MLLVLGLALLASPLRAHDLWIEPSSFSPAPGAPISAKLRVGVGFQGDVVPRDDAHLVKLALFGPSAAEQPLAGRDGGDPAGFGRIAEKGVYLIAYQTRPSEVDLDAAKVALYMKEEGLEPFLRLTPREASAGIRDRYARCAKALLMAGGEPAPGFNRQLGLPLELIPATLPARGNVAFWLLSDGKPLKDVLVTAIPRSAPGEPVSARTDARGRVKLPLAASGMWLVKAVHVTRAKEPRTWDSLWASLTFEVP